MNSKHELAIHILRAGMGGVLHELVKQGVAEVVALADESRARVADAALYLHALRFEGIGQEWLKKASRASIIMVGERAARRSGGLINPFAFQVSVAPGYFAGFGLGLQIDDDPKREENADVGRYLHVEKGVAQYWLRRSEMDVLKGYAHDLKSQPVTVNVTVTSLRNGDSGGYILLKFFKDGARVGETLISGKTSAPYVRKVELKGDFSEYRVECSPGAVFYVERAQ